MYHSTLQQKLPLPELQGGENPEIAIIKPNQEGLQLKKEIKNPSLFSHSAVHLFHPG